MYLKGTNLCKEDTIHSNDQRQSDTSMQITSLSSTIKNEQSTRPHKSHHKPKHNNWTREDVQIPKSRTSIRQQTRLEKRAKQSNKIQPQISLIQKEHAFTSNVFSGISLKTANENPDNKIRAIVPGMIIDVVKVFG